VKSFHPNKTSQLIVVEIAFRTTSTPAKTTLYSIDRHHCVQDLSRSNSFPVRTRSTKLKPCSHSQHCSQFSEYGNFSRCRITLSSRTCLAQHLSLPTIPIFRVTRLLNTISCSKTHNTPSRTPRVQTFGAETQIHCSKCHVEQSETFRTSSSAPVCLETKTITNEQSPRARSSFMFSTSMTVLKNNQRCACCPMLLRPQIYTM
jgi:hypothetical protein